MDYTPNLYPLKDIFRFIHTFMERIGPGSGRIEDDSPGIFATG
jgi:hypothetical protein